MKNTTKIVGLVAIVAIIVSSVAIGLSFNASQQTNSFINQATTQPTQQPTAQSTNQPIITYVYFCYTKESIYNGGRNGIQIWCKVPDSTFQRVSQVIVNNVNCKIALVQTTDNINYEVCANLFWEMSQTYTVTLTFGNGQTTTIKATATQQTIAP